MKRISVKIFYKDGKTAQYRRDKITEKIWRLLSLKPISKCHILISYGMKVDNYGHKVPFNNEGWYQDPREAKIVLREFWREE